MTAMDDPLVSVLIRVRDEAAVLERVLRSVRDQAFDRDFEIVVLDNESIDGSEQVAADHGARVFRFPRALFGYGRALNLGIQLCRGEIVILLSAHSIPQDRAWLAELVQPVRAGAAGAAFCRQVPVGGVSRLERRRFLIFPQADFWITREDLVRECRRGGDPYEVAVFSNSACAIRHTVATEHLFRDLLYAEDRGFVIDYLMAGGTVAYVSTAVVSYDRQMTWKSAYRIGYRAQVSKRLIRELAATYTGFRFNDRKETCSRVMRALLVIPAVLARLVLCLREAQGVRHHAAAHVVNASGATLGLAKGSLRWRRHRDTLGCDIGLLREARQQCAPSTHLQA